MATHHGPLSESDEDSTHSRRLLVIEDSMPFQVLLRTVLEQASYSVEIASTGQVGLELVASWNPDLIVLDLGLPDMDGMDVCATIRDISDAFVVMLTGRSDDDSRFEGLTIGADAYVTKPFQPRELLVPIEVLLRRAEPKDVVPDSLDLGDLRIDRLARQVWVEGIETHLTKIEMAILHCLAIHAGEAVTRQDLITAVWGPHWVGDDHVISVHVANLRKKVDPGGAGRITTVRGIGYRLAVRQSV